MYYVYALFRANGQPFWIGKGKGYRSRASAKYAGSNKAKASVIREVVESLGEVPWVVLHEGLDEQTAFEYERALIAAIGRRPHGPLVNLTDGGDGTSGFRFTEERRQRASLAKIGNKNALGTVHTPETRAKVAASKIGNKHCAGHRQSPEHLAKRIAAVAAWRASPEGQAKMAEIAKSHVGRKRSEATKAKIRAARARQLGRCYAEPVIPD